nr:hypothetical protein [Methylobacterium sp. L1A1]
MEGQDGQVVVSTRKFDSVEYLDDGNTIVAHFVCSDEQTVALMMTRDAMHELISTLADAVISDWKQRKKSST